MCSRFIRDSDRTATAGAVGRPRSAQPGFQFGVRLERPADEQTVWEPGYGLEHGLPFVGVLSGLAERQLEERKLAEGAGTAPAPACAGPVFETGAASLDLPAFREMAAQARFAPAPSRVTTGWTTVIPLSSGAAGRSCTCIGPFRRRKPGLFRRRQRRRLMVGVDERDRPCVAAARVPSTINDRPPTGNGCPGESRRAPGTCSVAGRDSASLIAVPRRGVADPMGFAPTAFPQTTGCSAELSYGSKGWEVLVTLQSSLPACWVTPGLRPGCRDTTQSW